MKTAKEQTQARLSPRPKRAFLLPGREGEGRLVIGLLLLSKNPLLWVICILLSLPQPNRRTCPAVYFVDKILWENIKFPKNNPFRKKNDHISAKIDHVKIFCVFL